MIGLETMTETMEIAEMTIQEGEERHEEEAEALPEAERYSRTFMEQRNSSSKLQTLTMENQRSSSASYKPAYSTCK
jgi:hypothetical protein